MYREIEVDIRRIVKGKENGIERDRREFGITRDRKR